MKLLVLPGPADIPADPAPGLQWCDPAALVYGVLLPATALDATYPSGVAGELCYYVDDPFFSGPDANDDDNDDGRSGVSTGTGTGAPRPQIMIRTVTISIAAANANAGPKAGAGAVTITWPLSTM